MIYCELSSVHLLWLAGVLSISVVPLVQYLHYSTSLLPTRKRKRIGAKANFNIIGHRGSKADGLPENTIASFKDAVSNGCQIVELDVWLSKDKQVIVHHDPDFRRMTSNTCTDHVAALDYHCYPSIVPTLHQSTRIASYSLDEYTRIPLLKDALKVIPDHISLIIEVKDDSDELIELIVENVRSHGAAREENVYWFSLIESVNAKLRRMKKYPTITSIPAMLKVLAYYYLGILPFVDLSDDVFGITVTEVCDHHCPHWTSSQVFLWS
jgi:glycerophosphoryl diester phosphodiesterase